MQVYFVYILECEDGSYYTGIATDVERRFREHRKGNGGHYTRAHAPARVAYSETQPDRSSALKREAEIKSWTHKEKAALVRSKRRARWGRRSA